MDFEVASKENHFDCLNQYIFEIQNLISASAASVLIIQNGVIINEWYSGSHDRTAHRRKVDAKSQFNIASIRKTYLGFAISLALFEGRIKNLNEYVSNYLDDVDENVIAGTTIRHLLTQPTYQDSSKSVRPSLSASHWRRTAYSMWTLRNRLEKRIQ